MKNNLTDRRISVFRTPSHLSPIAFFGGVALLLVFSNAVSLAALVFNENMGTPSGTESIAGNDFENANLTYSGTGDVRSTLDSIGYTGASGDGNVFLTFGGSKSFQISEISTVGYTDLILSFGAYKSAIASSMSELALSYSINGGSTFSILSIPGQASGTGTAVWRLISGISLPSDAAGVSDLRLRWVNTADSDVQFRLDDVDLTGTTIAAVPEPSTFIAGALLLLPFGARGVRYLRNQ